MKKEPWYLPIMDATKKGIEMNEDSDFSGTEIWLEELLDRKRAEREASAEEASLDGPWYSHSASSMVAAERKERNRQIDERVLWLVRAFSYGIFRIGIEREGVLSDIVDANYNHRELRHHGQDISNSLQRLSRRGLVEAHGPRRQRKWYATDEATK